LHVVFSAFRGLFQVFFEPADNLRGRVRELVKFAKKARREGIVSLDSELQEIREPFLKKSLMLAVDGTEPEDLRSLMELELDNQAENEGRIPEVFESAGGFSPTIGIIGAVLGLIQVMQHLDKIEEVGKGIAVAFVATIYGVGAANLILLPSAGKLKIRLREGQLLREMTLEGVISILEGMNPRMLENKLLGYLPESEAAEPEEREVKQIS
jgi:chemotaxis protein MotA